MNEALYDVSRWRLREDEAEFFWPVASTEVIAVRDAFLAELVPFLRAEAPSNRHAALLSCLIHLLGEVLATFQAQALIRRARAQGREPVFADRSQMSRALMADELPAAMPVVSLLRKGIAPAPMWKELARTGRSRWRGDVLRHSLMARIDVHRDVVAVASGEMINRHAAAVGGVASVPLFNWFSPLQGNEPCYAGAPPAEFVDRVLDIVRDAFTAGNETLGDSTARYLSWWIVQSLTLADRYLGRLLAAPNRVPRQLWRGTGGLVWSRLLSFACRELGGTVTGHDHSHGQGAWSSYSDTIIEHPFADRFMVHTELQRQMALRNIRADLSLPGKPPMIEVLPGGTQPHAPTPPPRAATPPRARPVIMYVGTLYVGDFAPFTPLVAAPVLADWEFRMFTRLKEWGYDIIFKPHPESTATQPSAEVYERAGVTVLSGRFENVMDQADVLMFAQANSSSCFAALRTDRPIVLPLPPLNPWQPEAEEMVRRRCAIVPSWADENNRLHTDWDRLKEAISLAPSLTDPTFRKTFFS